MRYYFSDELLKSKNFIDEISTYLERSVLPLSKSVYFLLDDCYKKMATCQKLLLILDAPANLGEHFCVPMRRASI